MEAFILASYWEYFDKIYCISLDERTDRQESAKTQFDKVGLSDKVEFLIVKKHHRNCEEGIYQSHMACIKKGLQAGARHIVIFEDDILFGGPVFNGLKNCIDFLSQQSYWNTFFFGCLVSGSKKTRHEGVLKVKYRSLSHAYVINRKFAQALAEKPWQGLTLEVILRSFQEGLYANYPSFAFQSNSPTDNDKYLRLDKFRRLCGGLRRIQKRNELYHRHKAMVITLHVVLILLGILWIF